MLFNSLEFAFLLPLTFFLFWFVFKSNLKWQNIFLIVVSYVFYGWWDFRFLSLIILSSTIDYFIGLNISRSKSPRNKKYLLYLSLFSNLGILMFFKYFNFFIENFIDLSNSIGINANVYTLKIILPVGISFYTFQTLSYTIDVYKEKMKATEDPIAFFAFVSFFPQLVAGPIERANNLLPQFFSLSQFDYKVAKLGLKFILWGFYKKVVIADNCAPIVNHIFADYASASGVELIIGIILFALQIYCDFSGYSDIAIGIAGLFGFQLMINFKTPYFSRDIAEFWRRWHISLSTWFRDYVYIPLGGSRVRKVRQIYNTFAIFVISGFWHGANWTFIIWGALNALYFLPLLLLKQNRNNVDVVAENSVLPSMKEVFQMSLTFFITCIAWVFFRSDSLVDAMNYFNAIISNNFYGLSFITIPPYLPFLIFILVIIDWLGRKNGVHRFLETINNKFARYSLYYFIVITIWFYGAFEKIDFIYFQF